MGTGATLPGQSLPGRALAGFGVTGPLQGNAPQQFTIANPPAPPGQMLTNIQTLINGQMNLVGLMLFLRFTTPGGAAVPNSALPGNLMPGFTPTVSPALSALLVEGVDYTRVGGQLTMTIPPAPGTMLTANVFVKGLQLGGATPNRYVAPYPLAVTGAYDGVATAYSIVLGPTIFGATDGKNNLLTWGISFQRVQIFKNGILQTFNVDVTAGQTAMVFLPGAVPQPGDFITLLGYNNC